jgi:hypothetical protein
MSFTDRQKANFVLKFAEEGYNYASFKLRIKRDAKRSQPRIPDIKSIKSWVEAFRTSGTVHGERGKNKAK